MDYGLLSYLLLNKVKVPAALWAVPYTETFSLACAAYGGHSENAGNSYVPVYGHPQDAELVEQLRRVAEAGYLLSQIREMNVALMGPRQTWRVAGPQDMSMEEWEFSRKFGTTIVHLEMDEILDRVAKNQRRGCPQVLKGAGRPHRKAAVAPPENMLYAAKVYQAVRDVIQTNRSRAWLQNAILNLTA